MKFIKKLHLQVVVAVSHVSPFGDVKVKQQNALFSLNSINKENSEDEEAKFPVIIVGDLNRFSDESDDFEKRLVDYNLIEVNIKKLIVPPAQKQEMKEYKKEENIGTFMPWPVDAVYKEKLKKPLSDTRLDVQLYTDDKSMIELKTAYIRASMMKENRNEPIPKTPDGVNRLRHFLDCRMTSDHIPIIGTYYIR